MDGAAELPHTRATPSAQQPLLRLLGYVRKHPAPAVLTAFFGTSGFLLSFVFPSPSRALLEDPRILILDEATSALDTQSEELVQRALDRLMRGRTCFIIAHRLSTVRHADRILVLQRGKLVESGSHDALLARGGVYAQLLRASLIQPQQRC